MKGISHVIGITEHLAANTQDHPSVPGEECFEGRFVVFRDKAFWQFTFRRSHGCTVPEQPLELMKEGGS